MVNQAKNSLFIKRYRWQIIAGLAVDIVALAHGVAVGWLAPSLHLLDSEDSPLGKPLTVAEASWIGSMIGLGYLAGNIIFGLLLDRVGRKLSMYLLAVPNMLNWILIYLAQDVNYLYAARFLGGVTGGGIYIVLPIFISEIVDSSIRGALSSLPSMFVYCGILLGYILSSYLPYWLMPCISIALPIIYLLAIICLAETPQYLLRYGRVEEAEKSYIFYKNLNKAGSNNITDNIETAKNEFELFREQVLKGGVTEKIALKDFFNKPTLKVFGLIFVLIMCNQMSGSFAIFNYTSIIFEQLGTQIDIRISTTILGVAQVLGISTVVLLVDRYGRRVLLLSSLAGLGLGELALGLLKDFASAEFKANYDWLPVLLICWIAIISSVGLVSLLFTISIELLPAKIRSIGTSLSMATFSIFIFIALKIYPALISDYGLGVAMYMSASVCAFGFIVLGLFLPETKGKQLEQ